MRRKIVDQVYGKSFGTETAEIINVIYPESVAPGEIFTISYDARNNTSSDLELWGEIQDDVTKIPISGSEWSQTVAGNMGTYHSDVSYSIDTNWVGLIVIGHYGEEIVCTNPDGTDGQIICGDKTFGQDPTHRYLCEAGTWTDQGYNQSCAPPNYAMFVIAGIIVVGVIAFIALKKEPKHA